MSQDIVELIQTEVYGNFEAGNFEGVVNAFADNIRYHHQGPSASIPFAGVWEGKAAVAEMLQTFGSTTEPVFVEIKAFVAQGDRVVVLSRESYRVRATGKSYETEVAHIWTVQDGKVVACDELYDSAAVAAAFS